MNRMIRRGGLALSAVALVSCASVGLVAGAGASTLPQSGHAASTPTDTPAAELYSALDQLLVEHVDLTVAVVETAVTKGATSTDTKGAEAALGQNTDALGAAVGSVYGAAAKAKFLQLWRAHIGYFINYTLGKATHNQAMVATAQRDLNGYISSFAAFMAGATKLPVAALEADLRGHVSTLEAAIDDIVSHRSTAGTAVEMAAAHMNGTAQVLAEGIASSAKISGDVNSPASGLRAALTGLLIQHVAATGFVVETAIAAKGNLKNPEVVGAVKALGQNTNQLGAAIGTFYGSAAQTKFLQLWRAHIGYFINYTLGKATHNQAMVATAQRDLNGYISSFAAFMAGATKLPVAALEADLRGHVSTLEAAIDDMVAGKPTAGQALLMAENHMAGTAAVLSGGIVASMPSKFSS